MTDVVDFASSSRRCSRFGMLGSVAILAQVFVNSSRVPAVFVREAAMSNLYPEGSICGKQYSLLRNSASGPDSGHPGRIFGPEALLRISNDQCNQVKSSVL